MPDIGQGLLPASISAASSGDNTVVAAVAGQRIFVYRMFFMVASAVDVIVKDGAGTNMTGPLPLNNTIGLFLEHSDEPWFVTTAGNALILNLSAAIQASGRVYYKQVA